MINKGHEWILNQREIYRPTGRPLLPDAQERFLPYFGKHILESARVAMVPRIENPPFYIEFIRRGAPVLLQVQNAVGITFVDCIVIATRFHPSPMPSHSLLFHELVHVLQYEILGTHGVIDAYIRGWEENDFQYEKIPIEQEAYQFQQEFERNKNPFLVRERLIGGGRL
jgi:hypothetical protein